MTASPSPWNVRDHLPAGRFVIQSHRGAGTLAAENTLAAFELGWKLGTCPEADLRATRDGVIVTFHDGDFSRVVKGANATRQRQGVQDLTYDELTRLEVGEWKNGAFVGHRVPRIDEVFEAMRDRPVRHLYMDIKNVDLAALAREVDAHGVHRQVLLASPKAERLVEWKTLVPESKTLLWMGGSEEVLRPRIDGLRATGFAGITQLQIHIHPNAAPDAEPFTLPRAFIVGLGALLRAHGILFQALPYTTDAGVYAALLDLGVVSFATDHPDTTLQAVHDYYAPTENRI